MSESEKTMEKGAEKTEKGEERKTLAEGCTGKVKWFNCRQGYGFIHWTAKDEDIFVHRTAIQFSKANKEHASRTLDDEEEVEFDVRTGRKGLKEAWSITGPQGAVLRGSRFARTREQAADIRKERRKAAKDAKKEAREDADKDPEANIDGKGDGAGTDKPKRAPRRKPAKPKGADGDAKDKESGEEAKGTTGGESGAEAGEGRKRKGRTQRRRRKTDSERGEDSGRRRRASSSQDDAAKDPSNKDTAKDGPKDKPPTPKDSKDSSRKGLVKEMIDKVHGLSIGEQPKA